jgi:dTDP-glucose pyrophosphorylase
MALREISSDLDTHGALYPGAREAYNDFVSTGSIPHSMPERFWQKAILGKRDSILTAIRIIDSAMTQLALVVDENRKLVATVTDGDIRRALLQGIDLSQPITKAMNRKFQSLPAGTPRMEIRRTMLQHRVRRLPLLDAEGRVAELVFLEALVEGGNKDNWVVIMAGGLGTRLRPLTQHTPKPMVKVGERPILETILNGLSEQGFHRVCLAVNYKADIIRKHFKDGRDLGMEIRYVQETQRLGSAGALGLLPEKPAAPFLVMKADLLTNVAYSRLLDYHLDQKVLGTLCVKEYRVQVPYGVVQAKEDRLEAIEEKPVKKFFVNAGIYVLEPEALDLVPAGKAYDMPALLDQLRLRGDRGVALFPIREYWLDIGKKEDYARANREVRQLEREY